MSHSNKSKNWLPQVLTAAGGINLILLLFSWIVFSKLMSIYQETTSKQYPFISILTILIFGVIALTQVLYGIYLWSKQKKKLSISGKLNAMGIILLVIGSGLFLSFGLPLIGFGFIFPLYNLSNFHPVVKGPTPALTPIVTSTPEPAINRITLYNNPSVQI